MKVINQIAHGKIRSAPPIRGPLTAAAPRPTRLRWNFAEWFVLSQTFIPALLYLPGSQAFRVPIRMASYGISLMALAYWAHRALGHSAPGRRRWHPAAPWLIASLIYLSVMLLHPSTNTLLAGAVQIGISLAVLAPVFWAPHFVREPARLQRLLWLTLLCSGVNAFVGVMQARNPTVWMPREFSAVVLESEGGLGTAIYEGSNGQVLIRPPGLLDAPGAVAGPAVFALYLGLVFVAVESAWWKRCGAAVCAALGAAAIFLTLVRVSLLVGAGMLGVYSLVQIWRGQLTQVLVLSGVAAAAIAVAFAGSASLGGESLTSRFSSILQDDPLALYYENRGNQVADGFATLLPKYPLGAGLGRWGMTNTYFGDPLHGSTAPIWVEIQIPAWIVDGGVVLLILYPMALLATLGSQLRNALSHNDLQTRALAGIVFAAGVGLTALCFSYTVFVSPLGVQFWFLAGALHGVTTARETLRKPLPPVWQRPVIWRRNPLRALR